MNENPDQSQFINELLEQQDSVIAQLDDLILKIEDALKLAVASGLEAVNEDGQTRPREQAAAEQAAGESRLLEAA